jgi:thiamine biosynthesis lipoprotein
MVEIVGAVATSSTRGRRWGTSESPLHHLLDPRTGEPVRDVWRTVSVAASTCVAANTATTEAIVRGGGAVGRLRELCLPARLVDIDGQVVTMGGWPEEVDVP